VQINRKYGTLTTIISRLPLDGNNSIKISKVLVRNFLNFCDTFRLVHHSTLSDHHSWFTILRLYTVVTFGHSPIALRRLPSTVIVVRFLSNLILNS